MTLWQLIVRQIRQRGLSSTLTALSVALGVMLVIGILLLQDQMEEHFRKPGQGYHIVVGAPGSALQLTLNAIYHMDKSPGLMPMRFWPELEENDSVALAVPYAVGDSFRGYRVVATTDALFHRRFPHPEGEGEEKLAAGRPFDFNREGLYRRLRGLGASGFEPTQPAQPELSTLRVAVGESGSWQVDERDASLDEIKQAIERTSAKQVVVQQGEHELDEAALISFLTLLRELRVGRFVFEKNEGFEAETSAWAYRITADGVRLEGTTLDESAFEREVATFAFNCDSMLHQISLLVSEDAPISNMVSALSTLDLPCIGRVRVQLEGVEEPKTEVSEPSTTGQRHSVFEAVLGAEVAAQLGIRVGDEIEPTHGVEGGVAHDHVHLWKVVGIFKPTRTPVDKVVFINLDSFFAIEEHLDGALIPGTTEAGLSSILIFPRPGVHKAMLLSSLNRMPELTVADVSEQIRNLFSIVGSVDTLFLVISVMVVVLGVLSILVAIYNTMNERRREVAILRAIGASRATVFSSIVGEAALLTFLGACVGLLLGHLLVVAAASRIDEIAGFRPDAFHLLPLEVVVIIVVVSGGALAGLVPAWKAYRTDVAKNLKPLS